MPSAQSVPPKPRQQPASVAGPAVLRMVNDAAVMDRVNGLHGCEIVGAQISKPVVSWCRNPIDAAASGPAGGRRAVEQEIEVSGNVAEPGGDRAVVETVIVHRRHKGAAVVFGSSMPGPIGFEHRFAGGRMLFRERLDLHLPGARRIDLRRHLGQFLADPVERCLGNSQGGGRVKSRAWPARISIARCASPQAGSQWGRLSMASTNSRNARSARAAGLSHRSSHSGCRRRSPMRKRPKAAASRFARSVQGRGASPVRRSAARIGEKIGHRLKPVKDRLAACRLRLRQKKADDQKAASPLYQAGLENRGRDDPDLRLLSPVQSVRSADPAVRRMSAAPVRGVEPAFESGEACLLRGFGACRAGGSSASCPSTPMNVRVDGPIGEMMGRISFFERTTFDPGMHGGAHAATPGRSTQRRSKCAAMIASTISWLFAPSKKVHSCGRSSRISSTKKRTRLR